LVVVPSAKYVTAQLVHFENGVVVEASTKEWALKKQLFKTSDFSAYTNLAKVFAQRCLESGFIEMKVEPMSGLKIEKFMEVLKQNGLVLDEPKEIEIYKDRTIHRHKDRKSYPSDWREIVEHH
jgi:large subunit ribosomal protein L18